MKAVKILIVVLCLLVVLALSLLTAKTAGADTGADILEPYKLCLEREVDRAEYNAAGEIISYTYRIVNCGTEVLEGPFWVSDSRVAGVSCQQIMWGSPPSWYLLPGNWITCTGQSAVNATDMTRAYILSVAQAEGAGLRSAWVWSYVYNGTFRRFFLPLVAR